MPLFRPRVALDPELMDRVRTHVAEMGYATVDEFVRHCIEKELATRAAGDDAVLTERLKGLGYLD